MARNVTILQTSCHELKHITSLVFEDVVEIDGIVVGTEIPAAIIKFEYEGTRAVRLRESLRVNVSGLRTCDVDR